MQLEKLNRERQEAIDDVFMTRVMDEGRLGLSWFRNKLDLFRPEGAIAEFVESLPESFVAFFKERPPYGRWNF